MTENYEYEERAAIYEYEAGMSREDAEAQAKHDMMKGEQVELWRNEIL